MVPHMILSAPADKVYVSLFLVALMPEGPYSDLTVWFTINSFHKFTKAVLEMNYYPNMQIRRYNIRKLRNFYDFPRARHG